MSTANISAIDSLLDVEAKIPTILTEKQKVDVVKPFLPQQETIKPPVMVMVETNKNPSNARHAFGSPQQADKADKAEVLELPDGWTFTGNFSSKSDMLISGDVNGDIKSLSSKATITLNESCTSVGQIEGRNIVFKGTHSGNTDASNGRVTIEDSSRIKGEIIYSEIKMNGGMHEISMKFVSPDANS